MGFGICPQAGTCMYTIVCTYTLRHTHRKMGCFSPNHSTQATAGNRKCLWYKTEQYRRSHVDFLVVRRTYAWMHPPVYICVKVIDRETRQRRTEKRERGQEFGWETEYKEEGVLSGLAADIPYSPLTSDKLKSTWLQISNTPPFTPQQRVLINYQFIQGRQRAPLSQMSAL